MSELNYAGIDYSGPGSTANRDPETGIRFGVISQHSIQPDVMSEIWDWARDLSYEAAKAEAEVLAHRYLYYVLSRPVINDAEYDKLEARAREILPSGNPVHKPGSDLPESYDEEVVRLAEALSNGCFDDAFNDRYESGDDRSWLWEKDDYVLSNCLITDVFVSRSPYFTYAQFCSPCVPGAGNLDHPYEVPEVDKVDWEKGRYDLAEMAGFPRVFCLGHDFFEGGVAPYPVLSVATGKLVEP